MGSLGTPAASNLKCKDNKPSLLRAQELGVGAFLSPAGEAKSGATVLPLMPARSSIGIERGHTGRYLRFRCVGMCSLRFGCVGFSGVFRAALLLGRWLGFLCMMR